MTHYGFRLFEVTLRRGRLNTKLPFQQAGVTPDKPRHFREPLVELLKDLQGKLLIGQPKVMSAAGAGVELDADAPLQEQLVGQTAFRFQAFREDEGLTVGILRRGRYGTFDVAMGSDEETPDVPLTGLAPSSYFRYVLNLPDEGTTAILAVEDIGRSCPVDLMLKWLGQHSRKLSQAQPALATGQLARPWWRLLGRQVTDSDQLARLLRDGAFGEVRLIKRAVTQGRTKRGRAFTVTSPGVSEGRIEDLKKTVLGWRPTEGTDAKPVSDAQGAQQLAALISQDLVGIDYDDGEIAVPGTGGRPLKPSKLSELFTYDQVPSDRRSSGVAFYRAVRAQVARLEAVTPDDEAGLEWPLGVDLEFPEVTG